jgi:hemoglobin
VSAPTLFEQLGGEPKLRIVIDRFIDRLFDDPMIGFFFRNADRARIKQKEYEFAAAHLGAAVQYTGKPIGQAHAAHPIMGGQFARRREILKQTLNEADVPDQVVKHWLAHTDRLRPVITRDAPGHCDDGPAPAAKPSAAPEARSLPIRRKDE